MLRDEIAKYTELSGNDGEHTAIGIIGAYLDGYDKGLELSVSENPNKCFDGMTNGTPLDDVKAEIDKAQEPYMTSTAYDEGVRFGLMLAYQIVDRYKAESEEKVNGKNE